MSWSKLPCLEVKIMRFKWKGLEDCPVRIFIKRQFLKTIDAKGFVVSTKIDITRPVKRVKHNGKYKFFANKI